MNVDRIRFLFYQMLSRGVAQSARAPVSKTGGWGFESLRPCQAVEILRALILNKVGARIFIRNICLLDMNITDLMLKIY